MAKEKKIFQIQINGITESVDAVKSLNEQLREAEGIIKNLSNAKIDVKVSTGNPTTTEKVGTGTSSTDSKVQLDIEKEKGKQIEMQNEALREQYVERERLKQANKESLDDIKQEAKGYVEVVDGVKEYANTLNGMSAELKDIKKELRNTDMDTNAFKELTERAGELNEKLKKAEEAYGQFGRNVGNYTESVLEALRQWDEEKDFNVDFNISGAENSLNDLKAQLMELKKYWANLSPDNADFDKTAKAIKSLNQQIEDMESNLKDVGEEANSAFTGRFTTTIGGVETSFSNASEACEALRKKLVAMRVSGEENTPMYQEIIQLVRRLSKEVRIANQDVEGFTKTTRNIGKVVSVLNGLSGLAAFGQGVAQFFGGASEELDKVISKFAGLTMILSGLQSIQNELNSGQGAFAQYSNQFLGLVDKMVDGTSKMGKAINIVTFGLSGWIEKQSNLGKLLKDQSNAEKAKETWKELQSVTNNERQQVLELIKANDQLSTSWNNLTPLQQRVTSSMLSMEDGISKMIRTGGKVGQFGKELETAAQQSDSLATAIEKCAIASAESRTAFQDLLKQSRAVSSGAKEAGVDLTAMGGGAQFVAKGINVLTVAMKGLMKTTIILAAISLAFEGLTWLIDELTSGVKYCWQEISKLWGVLSDSDAEKVTKQIDDLTRKLDNLSKEYEIQVKLGNMGEVEAQLKGVKDQLQNIADIKNTFNNQDQFAEWQKEIVKNLDKTDEAWQKLTKTEQEAAEALQGLASIEPEFIESLKDKSPSEQVKALEKALKDAGASAEQLSSLEAVLAQDEDEIEKFLDKLAKIDSDFNEIGVNGVKQFGRLGTAVSKARQDTANAAARMKKDLVSLTQRQYQLQLSLNDDDIKTRLEIVRLEMEALAKQYGFTMGKKGNKSVVVKKGGKFTKEERAIAQRILAINNLEEDAARKANKAAQDRKNKEAADGQKQAVDNAKKLSRAETAARLEAMEDGMEKEIAILEQKRKEEIEDAKETGKRVVDINTIYDRQILEVKKKYAKYVEDVEREHTKRLEDIAKDFLTSWSQIQREIEDTRADTSMGNVENKNITVKQNISYDTNTQGSKEGINAQKKYYEQLKQSEIQYLNEKEQIEKEAAQRDYQRQLEDEDARFKASKEAQKKELEELERSLKEKVDAHQITEVEANKILKETRDEYLKGEEKDLQTHNEKMQSITENGKAVLMNIELQYNEERKAATASALEEQRKVTQDFYNDIDSIMERTQKRKTNDFGFINYGAYRQSLQDALNSTKEVANQIESEKEALQNALDNNEISFDDFQKAKKELDDFGEEVKDKTDDLKDGLSNSFNTWMSGVMESINSYSSVLSGMFDSISEMYTRQLDAEQEKLDKQQELLDAELEMIEENLQKQEEVTQEHNDKVNSIEDELKSARGDRRQALIDQLAAERKAQEQSIEKEKQLTEEKKKQAQKQEQLKKQQDALEKKRRQQEKRASIVQATINTFTAVSNALAVQPWFVGLALSAVALGLGMANVAQISSQQYANGGLLNGKRHSQGGMKIQGTNMEVEGGEYVTNRTSTNANLPLLEYINSNRRTLTKDDLIKFYDNGKTTLINRPMQTKFEEGGQLPQLSVDVKSLMNNAQAQQDDRPLVVSVVDIVNQTENLRQVRVLAGDIDE